MSAGGSGPVSEMTRRILQALMFVVPMPIVLRNLWLSIVFPQDGSPWLMMVALTIAAMLPITIWCRERSWTRKTEFVERIVAAAAVSAGSLLFVVFAARIGFLLTGPYTGPMAAEATLYFLAIYSIAAVGCAFLVLSPLILDGPYYTAAFRRRAWKVALISIPIAAVASAVIGSRVSGLSL